MDEIDEEGEAALAELEAQEERELSAQDAIAELQRRGARPLLQPSPPDMGSVPVVDHTLGTSPSARGDLVRFEESHALIRFEAPEDGSFQSSTCMECGHGKSQAKFFEAFGLHVCFECQRANRGAGGKYQVLTKSKAKDEYLLTDRQLDDSRGGLGSIRLPNPNDSRYGDMRLYLRTQVEELAIATWGSSEELLIEKERRSEERLRRAEAKRKLKLGTPEEQILARCGGHGSKALKLRKGRGDLRAGGSSAPLVVQSAPKHTHVFLPDEEYCEETDMWTKRCACGFSTEYERL
eukprot:scaffold291293_cov35-Tisochrysis_lutea.AAC.1